MTTTPGASMSPASSPTPSGVTSPRAVTRAVTRVVSVAEAVSFLLLLVAAVIKRTADAEGGVTVLGPVHGALFLAYCALIVTYAMSVRWPRGRTLLALGASVLPVAPLLVERAWLRAAPEAPQPRAERPPRPRG